MQRSVKRTRQSGVTQAHHKRAFFFCFRLLLLLLFRSQTGARAHWQNIEEALAAGRVDGKARVIHIGPRVRARRERAGGEAVEHALRTCGAKETTTKIKKKKKKKHARMRRV
jgi:hypothetical protein